MATSKTVKDVSPHEFVKAYAAHLKRSGKVCTLPQYLVSFVRKRSRIVKTYNPNLVQPCFVLGDNCMIELPDYTDLVKTAKFKELAPYDPDWYYIRAASVARKIYLRGGLGVGAFRRIYGGSKRNGSRPPHFCRSSGAVLRHILQQLANNNIVEVDPKGGRKITSHGRRDLDQVSGRIVV
ncbi:hypothetical protein G4B88_027353 [Cannabis sativa]|uniref:40S ribosomal protein S19 n=1 Tax=Cannabis sativa TaxID=3483 RepID=A0A7J6HQQ4_CANSA|nr:hypothetical protein G4B88_027353 [Cannabis sativa]